MAGQLSHADVTRLHAEKRYDEITNAKSEGRLAQVLGASQDEIALLDRAATERLSRQDVKQLFAMHRYDLIEQARAEGRVDYA